SVMAPIAPSNDRHASKRIMSTSVKWVDAAVAIGLHALGRRGMLHGRQRHALVDPLRRAYRDRARDIAGESDHQLDVAIRARNLAAEWRRPQHVATEDDLGPGRSAIDRCIDRRRRRWIRIPTRRRSGLA